MNNRLERRNDARGFSSRGGSVFGRHRKEVQNRPDSTRTPKQQVLVVESRGKPHPHLDLIGAVDFSRRGYVGLGIGGISHFYAGNLRVLDKSVIVPAPLGGLTPFDFKQFFAKIDALLA